jgi:hypothetical protein
MMTQVSTSVGGSTPLPGLLAPPPAPTAIPAGVLASAQGFLATAQNFAHALLAVFSAAVIGVEGVTEVLHQLNIDTSGADWRLTAVAGGLLAASKTVDSVSWSSILKTFTGGTP